jgi:thiol:disulfide interchange protein DsbD
MRLRNLKQTLIARIVQAFALFALAAACAGAQERQDTEINPIKWTLTALQPAKPIKAGEVVTLQLTASIEDGWHLYSTEELPQGPKPTRIALIPNQPFELSDIDSPSPLRAVDPNFGVETEFYEHSATFRLSVQVKSDAPAGTQKVGVQVRYQSCTETLCLLPRLVRCHASERMTPMQIRRYTSA